MTISCSGEELILSKDRAIYWRRESMLIISDLHLGKSAHFRKHGIQVPAIIGLTDLRRLTALLHEYHPKVLLITGDMFHHDLNSDIGMFAEWRRDFEQLRIFLVLGNHDALRDQDYEEMNIEVYKKEMLCHPFRFIHDRPEVTDTYYTISGHLHPGISVYGKARQQLKLPCFYFGKNLAIMPAFSIFTGLSIVRPEPGDRCFAIGPSKVTQVF